MRNYIQVFFQLLCQIDSLDSLKFIIFELANFSVAYPQGKRVPASWHTFTKDSLKYFSSNFFFEVGSNTLYKLKFKLLLITSIRKKRKCASDEANFSGLDNLLFVVSPNLIANFLDKRDLIADKALLRFKSFRPFQNYAVYVDIFVIHEDHSHT